MELARVTVVGETGEVIAIRSIFCVPREPLKLKLLPFHQPRTPYLTPISKPVPVFLRLSCPLTDQRATGLCIAVKSLLELLVRPSAEVLDWRSHISGCSARAAAARGVPAAEARAAVRALLGPSTTIVGHGLHHDLQALRLAHTRVVDTALLFPPAVIGGRGRRGATAASRPEMSAAVSLPLRFLVHALVDGIAPEAYDGLPCVPVPVDSDATKPTAVNRQQSASSCQQLPPPHDSLEDARMALAVANAAVAARVTVRDGVDAAAGEAADESAGAAAPRFTLPGRPRAIDVRGLPFDWEAHAAALPAAPLGASGCGGEGGGNSGESFSDCGDGDGGDGAYCCSGGVAAASLLDTLFDGAWDDVASDGRQRTGGSGGGFGGFGGGGRTTSRSLYLVTPPCYTIASGARADAASTLPETAESVTECDAAAVPLSGQGSAQSESTVSEFEEPRHPPVQHQQSSQQQQQQQQQQRPAVVGAATVVFGCRADRDACFDALLLRSGALRQVSSLADARAFFVLLIESIHVLLTPLGFGM